MFNWLKRGANNASSHRTLTFRTNGDAFKYACQFMTSDLSEGAFLPALLLDASKECGTHNPVAIDANGIQTALLLVCSKDGGFRAMARSASSNGPRLLVGDLVAWQAAAFCRDLASVGPDERFGWTGFIIGKLMPEWRSEIGWVGAERFR